MVNLSLITIFKSPIIDRNNFLPKKDGKVSLWIMLCHFPVEVFPFIIHNTLLPVTRQRTLSFKF